MGGIEVGPARVWLPEFDVPGLAMSRSLGDYVAQSVGVTPEPGKKFYQILKIINTYIFPLEFNIYDINQNDRIIIIASDGVWEFLSNEKVGAIALQYYKDG